MPDSTLTDKLPNWWGGRKLLMAGAGVGVLIIMVAVLVATHEYDRHGNDVEARLELYTRLAEQQVANTLDASEIQMQALDDDIIEMLRDGLPTSFDLRASLRLGDAFRGKSYIREISVITPAGQVVASSSPENANARIDLSRFGAMPKPGEPTRMGDIMVGRGLISLQATALGRQGSAVLPLIRQVSNSSGQSLYVVELFNLDYLTGQLDITFTGRGTRAIVASYGGRLFGSTGVLEASAGAPLNALGAFTDFLPKRESGSYLGKGIDGGSVFTAFRTLRQWPVVVITEIPESVVMARLRDALVSGALVTASLLLLIASATLLAWRSFQRHLALQTKLALANDEAAAINARSNAVLSSALDGILTIDHEGKIVDFNTACEHMFGYSAAAAIGIELTQLVTPTDQPDASWNDMSRFDTTGTNIAINRHVEVTAKRSGDRQFPAELSVVPVVSNGKTFFTATIRDITERKRVESALRSSSERFRATFEQAAVGMLQQGPDRRFLRVNQALCKLVGYTREEFLALPADQLVHPDERDTGLLFMRRLFAGQIQNFSQEKRYRHKQGHYIWVRLTASLAHDRSGAPLYMISIIEDIHQRRAVEQELEHARARELMIGSRIQQSLLVAAPPGSFKGLALSAFSQDFGGINGDFFDVLKVGEDSLDIVVGDVMGKGIPAALMGAATKLQFSRSLAELLTTRQSRTGPPEPCEIVTAVNHAMAPHLQALEAFVTLVYLRINVAHDTITWVGCGHEESLVLHANGASESLANQHPPLGILKDEQFVQESCSFGSGSALFLCSDGATDALLSNGEHLGRAKVNEAVCTACSDPTRAQHVDSWIAPRCVDSRCPHDR